MKTLVLMAVLSTAGGAGLTGYNCGKRMPHVATVSLTEVGPCEIADIQPEVQQIPMQLLQYTEREDTDVRQCRIWVDQNIARCGMFSHVSIVNYGETTFVRDISKDLCEDLIRYGQFKYGDSIVDGLNVNVTNNRTIVVAGQLKDSGKCEGVAFASEGHDYENVVVTAKLEIDFSDYMAAASKTKNELILANGLRCPYTQGRCRDGQGNYNFWTTKPRSSCGFEEYVVVFEGEGTRVTDGASDNRTLYFANSTDNVQFGLAKVGKTDLCGYRIIHTEHPKLMILEAGPERGFAKRKTLAVHEILQDAYFNTKISYLAGHVKTQFDSLYKDILLHRCNLERQILINALSQVYTQPDLFAHTVMKEPGYTAVSAGEVAHIIKCEAIPCKLRITPHCYEELPVICEDDQVFLKPKSRIQSRVGTPRDCNGLLPTYYQLGANWHRFPPTSEGATTPSALRPQGQPTWKYEELNNLMDSGLYAAEDLERLQEHIMFPAQRTAYLEQISRKVSDHSVPIGSAKFENLIDNNAIEKAARSALSRVWGGFTNFGIFFAGILGIILILQTIKIIADTLIHGYMLYTIYGWSIHLRGALFGSVTHLLTCLARPNASQPTQQGNMETAPEQGPLQQQTPARVHTLPTRTRRSVEQLERRLLAQSRSSDI